MNQSGADRGQSMEDILSSIRKIIAEGEQNTKEAPPAAPTQAAKPAKSDVYELTEAVQDDGTVIHLGPPPGEPEGAAKPADKQAAEAAAIPMPAPAGMSAPAVDTAAKPAASPAAAASDIEEKMAALARLIDVGRDRQASPSAPAPAATAVTGSPLTVEQLVRDAVQPLLRQWLDANLPPLVERAVREAVEKIAKRPG